MYTVKDAIHLLEGIHCKKNIKKGLEIINELADAGDIEAQFCLARFYWEGIYYEQNNKKAIYWYEKTAENGHPFSQFWLGNNYINGTKTEIDDKKAFYWYEKAANNNVISAHYHLGLCYLYGWGVEYNYDKAMEHISFAADHYMIIADLMLLENEKENTQEYRLKLKSVLEKYKKYIGVDKEITQVLADAYKKGYGVPYDLEKSEKIEIFSIENNSTWVLKKNRDRSITEFNYIVKDPVGLHMRPGKRLTELLETMSSEVFIEYNDRTIEANSILNLICAGIVSGSKIKIIVKGDFCKEDAENLKRNLVTFL